MDREREREMQREREGERKGGRGTEGARGRGIESVSESEREGVRECAVPIPQESGSGELRGADRCDVFKRGREVAVRGAVCEIVTRAAACLSALRSRVE